MGARQRRQAMSAATRRLAPLYLAQHGSPRLALVWLDAGCLMHIDSLGPFTPGPFTPEESRRLARFIDEVYGREEG